MERCALLEEWKADYLVPSTHASEQPESAPSDLQKELGDKNDVIQDSPNPEMPSMQDVKHPSSWRLLYVPLPAAPANLASSDGSWKLEEKNQSLSVGTQTHNGSDRRCQ